MCAGLFCMQTKRSSSSRRAFTSRHRNYSSIADMLHSLLVPHQCSVAVCLSRACLAKFPQAMFVPSVCRQMLISDPPTLIAAYCQGGSHQRRHLAAVAVAIVAFYRNAIGSCTSAWAGCRQRSGRGLPSERTPLPFCSTQCPSPAKR
jgi:hypothetical protein